MIDSQDDIVGLTRRCLVRVETPDGEGGSGFWVAPGMLLTCAHLASSGEVRVTWKGRSVTGLVGPAEPGRRADPLGLWPYPDIALITVPEIVDNECVWLSEQNISINTPVFLIGYSSIYTTEAKPHSASGTFVGTYGDDGEEIWRFTGDEIAPGMSGGPVLDLARGTVCGLIKTTRKPNSAQGGLFVPVRGLRQLGDAEQAALWRSHDRYHAVSAWSEFRQRLTATADPTRSTTLLAQEEVGLLDLVSRLTVTRDLTALYTEAAGPAAGIPPEPITSLRDLSLLLADRLGRPGQLHPLLRLAHRLAQAESGATGDGLREWTARVAGRRGEFPQLEQWRQTVPPGRHRAGDRPAIIVRIKRHTLDHTRYTVAVWVHHGAGRSAQVVCDESLGRDLAGTREAVAKEVLSQLGGLHGRAGVEFVVPEELFDEAFENLPVGKYSRLGRTTPVVIRDLDRLEDPTTWHWWEERWRAMRAGDGSARWLTCTDRHTEEEFDAKLRLSPEIALLGLARRPAQYAEDTLGVAIGAGVPAAVWSRDTCPGHEDGEPGEDCSGARFQRALAQALAGRRLADLPDVVQQLRTAAAAGREPLWSSIVLLWDDPEHRLEAGDMPFAGLT